uniref:Uncharacterized protein n=1 Tax=Cacopsylla melanoneura TaxID=428564 RepID=A0A8D8S2G0_9HEMI
MVVPGAMGVRRRVRVRPLSARPVFGYNLTRSTIDQCWRKPVQAVVWVRGISPVVRIVILPMLPRALHRAPALHPVVRHRGNKAKVQAANRRQNGKPTKSGRTVWSLFLGPPWTPTSPTLYLLV